MGTEARLVLHARDTVTADAAARSAFRAIARLDSMLSDYRGESELARLADSAGGGAQSVSADLLIVLARALALAAETEGAFDPTVGPLSILWRDAARTGRLPDPAALAAARALVDWHAVELDTTRHTARLARAGMRLDLGAIAKGYAADRALEALGAHGIARALVELGGEIRVGDAPPGEPGWRIAVPGTDSTVALARAAIASSGDTERFLELDGVRYSHVVDPRDGRGLTHRIGATVIAPDALTADGLATAVTLLLPARRAAFIASHPEARFLLVGPAAAATPP